MKNVSLLFYSLIDFKDAAGACQEYMRRDPENINFTVLALTAKMD